MRANRLKLLAIDDNQDNLITLQAVLTDRLPEARVLTARNGRRGLELARAEDPDVILLDIVMPEMDGYAVCRTLKKDEELRAIPVLFLTALRADRESRIRALEAGAEGFIFKPFDEVELVAQIRAMVKIKAANQLRRLEKEELEVLVAERTGELEQELAERKRSEREKTVLEAQLQQAQKLEAIGRLAGGVAHDFNNMLCVILMHTELAQAKMAPEHPLYADLTEIRNATNRSADLTRQLLAFARKQLIAPKVLDLNETMAGMLKMLQRLIGEGIQLSWQPQAELWSVKMDPSQIDQILANLCINARDSITDVGTLTIATGNAHFAVDDCAGHAEIVAGEYALLTISDNGCGMDKETLKRIFEPFFTTKEIGRGTGLGLATVYGIVKQNNGFICVYSEPGIGTTFKIYLPRYTGEIDPARTASVVESPQGEGETILLVEDEPILLKTIENMLGILGYKVLAVSRPDEAIRLSREHDGVIHLLMADVVLPGMNGRDMAEQVQSARPALKCLFMSGFTANIIAHHGVLDDHIQFLQKPFSRKDLASKIREVLAPGG